MSHLKKYYDENLLKFYGEATKYQTRTHFQTLVDQCYSKNWYSYTKKTFSGPLAVVQYLGRYTHRIALSNSRIISMNEHSVTFTVKDTKNGGQKNLTLKGTEFIRRFLMHILPKGFIKIRHYGLLANRNKKTKLKLSRKLTNSPTYPSKFEGLKTLEILCLIVGRDVTLCSKCRKGHLKKVMSLVPGAASP